MKIFRSIWGNVNIESDLEYSSELEEEYSKHQKKLEEENNRFEKKVNEIIEDSGVNKIVNLLDSINDKNEILPKQKEEIRNISYSKIYESMGRERTTIDKEISIRDDSIYLYRITDQLKLEKLLDYGTKIFYNATKQDTVLESLKLVKQMNLNQQYNIEEKIPESEYDKINLGLYPENNTFSSSKSFEIKIISENNNRTLSDFKDGHNRLDLVKFELLCKYKDEILDMLKTMNSELDKEIQSRKQIINSLENISTY